MTKKRFITPNGEKMSKRFVILDNCLYDGNESIKYLKDIEDSYIMVDLLNELAEENKQLKEFQDKVFEILDKKTEETFNKRINAKDSHYEYYKGKHEAVGELKKEIKNIKNE